MPIAAVNRLTNQRTEIDLVDDPRSLKQGEWLCQVCKEEMIPCVGYVRKPYFRHKVECPNKEYGSHPESLEHLCAKSELRNMLIEKYAEIGCEITVDIEVPIPEVKRIVDVLVTFPMGWRVAHEIQLAAITTEQLEIRSNDYLRAGIDVVWWLGNHASTDTNKLYCERRFGESNLVLLNR